MEINELRIGNWVKPNLSKYNVDFIRVNRIDDDDCVATINNYDSVEDFEPIPLHEGILAKCGFEKKDIYLRTWNTVYYAREEYGLIVDDGDLYLGDYYEGYEGGYEHYFYDNKIKYVHQLQNLNYSLTGKELEIKLD